MPQPLRYADPSPHRAATALPRRSCALVEHEAPQPSEQAHDADDASATCEATLPHESVSLLCEICSAFGTAPRFLAHSPSLTAAEKYRIVAPALVQKTITVQLDGVLLLCTAIGDPVLSRATFRNVAQRLGMPRAAAKNLHINPGAFNPLHCFEMAPGMVSPFLRPGRSTPIRALVLTDAAAAGGIDEQGVGEATGRNAVAVSLSLRWSLLIDALPFPSILREYAAHAYPEVQWVDLRYGAV